MPVRWPRPVARADSADGALLLFREVMRRVNPRLKRRGEGLGFGLGAKGHDVLVEAHLPLGFCHFFYQDLHC